MMRDYLHEENRKGKIRATIATVLYLALWALMFIFLSFSVEQNVADEGIMVDFGTSDTGLGTIDTPIAERQAELSQADQATAQKELMTQDIEDAVAVKKSDKKKEQNTIAQKPRQVDRQSLFPGRTIGSSAKSEGVKAGDGNQGKEGGQIGADHEGTSGTGISGTAQIEGRDIIGALPKPLYNANEQGRVVITVILNREGRVSSATFRPVGSTTQNATLVEAARRAALKAVFTPDASKDAQQGTITYNYRLK